MEKPQLKLYNTETRVKEVLKPLKDNHVRMYTCGPTVYHYVHIGNLRTFMFEDLLRRTIRYFGMEITQVMNLTDVDDKTIKGAIANKVSLDAFTKPYKEAFFQDLETLNIEPVEHYPSATDYIDEMVEFIQVLLDKGIAYKGYDGSIYYSIKKFSRYGCLSHLNMDELQVGASDRVASDEYDKDHLADFVLWKAYDPKRDGEIYWDSPFGKGRPGWHLECSAMAMKILGDTIDIHCGGIDNIFPHHENEIAQSEACSGKRFVKLWVHAEHLIVDGKKMSKSVGNFYTLRDLLQKGFSGHQIRYLLLQVHYKTQLNFTFAGLESAKVSLQRMNDFIQRMKEIQDPNLYGHSIEHLEKAANTFTESLADDLNISAALAAIFDLIREINILCDQKQLGREEAESVLDMMEVFDSVLGVMTFENPVDSIPSDLQQALERRMQARKDKNWALADELRDLIHSRGYVIEDIPGGARLKKQG